MIRKQVKALWNLCFHDSEEFTELYFRTRYTDENNLVIESGGQVIAALQMLPYSISLYDKELPMAYISGACTHPDYRNRGVMRELLAQSFAHMTQRDIPITTLIPAEPWLFQYYAQFGYIPAYYNCTHSFTAATTTAEMGVLEEINEYQEEVCKYLYQYHKQAYSCAVLHNEADFKVVVASMLLDHGHMYVLRKQGMLTAMALVSPQSEQEWKVEDLAANSKEDEQHLLQAICQQLNVPQLTVLLNATAQEQPLGMARIIQAHRLLKMHAAAHPHLEVNIELTDTQLSSNSGYYYISNGKCMKSRHRLPGSHLTLNIGGLAEYILKPLQPYMSLMLN